MTKEEFERKFRGVNGPAYRGARMPAFNESAVNESAFPDDLRYKEYSFDFKEGADDHIDVVWISQSWDCTDKLLAEIKRCLKYIGFVGTVYLRIRMRGETWNSEYAERHTITIRKGE